MARISTLLALLGLFGFACSKDERRPTSRLGNLGDACQTTSDCAGGHECRGSQCAASMTGISPNGNVCRLAQCTRREDCCVQRLTAAQCQSYDDDCEAGVTTNCELYHQHCVCDTARNACKDGVCVNSVGCSDDFDCTSSTLVRCEIGSGRCVACTQDSHCNTGRVCVGGTCALACGARSDCAAFYDCQEHHCVYVGCSEDRECKVEMGAESYCDETHSECVTPCANDAVCFNPDSPTHVAGSSADFTYQLCIKGTCTNVGCNTDDECKALLQAQISSAKSSGYPGATAQCRTP